MAVSSLLDRLAPPPAPGQDGRRDLGTRRVVDHAERVDVPRELVRAAGRTAPPPREQRPPRRLRHGLRHAAQDARPRIVDAVHAVTEAGDARLWIRALGPGQRPALAEARCDERLRPRRIADLLEHQEHVLVRAAVTRALQDADGRHHGGVEIGQRGHGHARREGRRVELVVGVQREGDVEDARDLGDARVREQPAEIGGVRAASAPGDRLGAAAEALPGPRSPGSGSSAGTTSPDLRRDRWRARRDRGRR